MIIRFSYWLAKKGNFRYPIFISTTYFLHWLMCEQIFSIFFVSIPKLGGAFNNFMVLAPQ
jgi:hypothetical protein